jgi:HK97 family phage major capsid protein
MMKFSVKRSNAISFPQLAETSRVVGSRLGGVQVYTENEAASLQVISPGTYSQKPTFSLSTITMNKYTGLLYATDELAMETSAFGTWAEYCYSLELAYKIENHAVRGNGVGQLEGVINSPALITVPAQSGQPPAGVVYLNVLDMVASLWSASKNQKKAIWLYHQSLLPTLMALTVPVGNAGSELQLWHFAEDDTQDDTLCGIPAYPSEYCSAPGSVGDLILCDWSRYAIGTREVRSDSSIHVLWSTDQSAFRWITRIGGHLIDLAPVTSSQGSLLTSTAITLAAR